MAGAEDSSADHARHQATYSQFRPRGPFAHRTPALRRVGAEDDDAVVVGAFAEIDVAVRQNGCGALAGHDHDLAALRGL